MISDALDTPEQNMTLERLKSLYELIGRMNSVYELQELLEFVVDRALSLTGGYRGLLLLSDGHEQKLQRVAMVRGKEPDQPRLEQALKFVSTTVIKDVLDQGEPRLVVDLPVDQRYEGITSTATLQNVRSVLAVPLKIETRLVGLIYIDHPKRGIFGQSDLDFLSAFANQAALAINRAQQHQRQIEELTRLNELSRSVVQVLDLDEVLTRIVHEATRMLNVETGSVMLLDETTAELTFAISISNGQRINIPTRLRKDQGIAGRVVLTGELACISDVSQDPDWFGEVETGFTTRSLLCVPLKLDGRVLGVLEALNKKSPFGFDSGDIALLSAFAASATIAIENARLFQEANQARQLRALNELALALNSTLDLSTVLNTGVEKSLEMLKAEAGAIRLINDRPQTDLLPVQVSRGLSSEPGLAEQQQRALSDLSALVLSDQVHEVLVIDEAHPAQNRAESAVLFAAGIKSLALAPIKTGQEISGTLVVMHTAPHTYSAEETSLLISIAHIVGLTVQKATHYNQVQTQTIHLAYLNEIGSALTSSLDLAHVLKVIIESVNVMLETERTSVFLIDPDTNELVLRYSNEGDADIRLPAPWQGIAGWVAANDQLALVNDTLNDPRYLRQVTHETGYEAHSILCVPLKVEGQVIGVVEVLNKIDGQPFALYHQNLLVEFTRWAAIAIHNARLFDERVQAYHHLADEQQRRIAAETRGTMAAVILDMAHTMNNIVGAIRVWASTMEHAIRSDPAHSLVEFQEEIGQIRQNAEEAIELIRKLRVPLDPPDLAPIDVHCCLDKAMQSCWWPENVHSSQHYGVALPLVKADAERLETVFYNLLSNSVQALAQTGGEIQVRTCRTSKGEVEITIADNGPGIPPELQAHVFAPGVSGKDGLGLGLWLVETFIHQFDGRIDFTSFVDEGTTFVVTLQPA